MTLEKENQNFKVEENLSDLTFELFNLKLKKKKQTSEAKKDFKPHLIRLLKKKNCFFKKTKKL
jgi:hypothetical protein